MVTRAVDAGPITDGRSARAQRTRTAVIDAILALIDDGDLRPTGPRIAERAGVSLRSVFQHFDDMEALLTEAADREVEKLSALVRELPVDGPLPARVEAWVAQRARIYEAVTPVRRASIIQEPFSPALQAVRDRGLRRSQREMHRVFAHELGLLSTAERREVGAALEAVTQWDAWEHLRTRSGLSVAAARRALARTTLALLRSAAEPADHLEPPTTVPIPEAP